MNGPEHYREAERLLRGSYIPIGSRTDGNAFDGAPTADEVAQAQVHATLALAAAQIEAAVIGRGADPSDSWDRALTADHRAAGSEEGA